MNKDRIETARKALLRFMKATGQDFRKEKQEGIVDLVANILHLSASLNFNPDDILRISKMHFDAEKEGL